MTRPTRHSTIDSATESGAKVHATYTRLQRLDVFARK
jgi:hypothetical protein